MDSTLIEQECIDELAMEAGAGPAVGAITEQAMRGEMEFDAALRARVALLRGLPASTVDKILRTRISLMPGATALIRTMRSAGAYAALVSGGFTSFTGPIAAQLGFDEHHANTLLAENGELTGAVGEPIFGRLAKAHALKELAAKLSLAPAETLAVGDGANDLAMVRAAGLGVAFRAKPALREAANAILDHADLTGLLFLQGYRREEFALVERA
jgi:phosphoserine phosphatase